MAAEMAGSMVCIDSASARNASLARLAAVGLRREGGVVQSKAAVFLHHPQGLAPAIEIGVNNSIEYISHRG
ncbi:MAG: hypothetical protein B6I25_01460 [Planctomycetales bacterium 4572_13]|nr:MAG: hypothetical protein B6I25_01460 [Planctomycetales bacterium 4572_13]